MDLKIKPEEKEYKACHKHTGSKFSLLALCNKNKL